MFYYYQKLCLIKTREMTSLSTTVKKSDQTIVSWNYDPRHQIIVYATSSGDICVKSLKLNSETRMRLTDEVSSDDPLAAISMDFDLVPTVDGLACILGNYAATVCLVEISPKLVTKVSEFDFKANVNRSIMTKECSILIGEPLIILSNKDMKPIMKYEPQDLGFKRTIKVGEVLDNLLYISSHEGKLVKLTLPKGKPQEVKGVYADGFKIWQKKYIVASDNVKHTVTLYNIKTLKPLLVVPFTKVNNDEEFPYINIYADGHFTWFPTSPSIITIILTCDYNSQKDAICRKDVDVKNSRKVLRIGNNALVDLYVPKDGVQDLRETMCEIKTLCYTSDVVKVDDVFISNRMSLTSSAFGDNQRIPDKYTQVSPPLKWNNVPECAKSLALVVTDPDATVPGFVHWIIYDIDPSSIKELKEGVKPDVAMFSDSVKQGINGRDKLGYIGPAPPPGTGTHRYKFHLYALNTMLVELKLNIREIMTEMDNHVLDVAVLTGLYGKD